MKKTIKKFTLLLAFVVTLFAAGCTEEAIGPINTEDDEETIIIPPPGTNP